MNEKLNEDFCIIYVINERAKLEVNWTSGKGRKVDYKIFMSRHRKIRIID